MPPKNPDIDALGLGGSANGVEDDGSFDKDVAETTPLVDAGGGEDEGGGEDTGISTPARPNNEDVDDDSKEYSFEDDLREILKADGIELDSLKKPKADEASGDAGTKVKPAEKTPAEAAKPAEPLAPDQPPAEGLQARPEDQSVGNTIEASRESLTRAVELFRSQQVDRLSKEIYALSTEDVQKIQEDPATYLVENFSRVASRIQVEAQLAAVVQMSRVLPAFLNHYMSTNQQAQTYQDQFFTRWPGLKDHVQSVEEIARVYRGLNPTAKPDKVIEDVGKYAMFKLGLTEKASAKETLTTPAGAVKTVRRQAFSPVAGRAAVAQPTKPAKPVNEFAEMAKSEKGRG